MIMLMCTVRHISDATNVNVVKRERTVVCALMASLSDLYAPRAKISPASPAYNSNRAGTGAGAWRRALGKDTGKQTR